MGGYLSMLGGRAIPADIRALQQQFSGSYTVDARTGATLLNVLPNSLSNSTTTAATTPVSAALVAEQLNTSIMSLQSEFINEDTGDVQYSQMATSPAFATYCEQARTLLPQVNLHELTPEQRKVFLLNLYNTLCIHGNIALGVPGFMQLKQFYNNTAYVVGSHQLSLDDIEHGILRDNAAHPTTGQRRFNSSSDPRIALQLPLDARIHFALNCGARSCPPIRIYTASNIERALAAATRGYLKREVTVNRSAREVTLSMLMSWYGQDFGGTDTAKLQWIVQRMEASEDTATLQQFIDSGKFSIKYSSYDWTVNNSSSSSNNGSSNK